MFTFVIPFIRSLPDCFLDWASKAFPKAITQTIMVIRIVSLKQLILDTKTISKTKFDTIKNETIEEKSSIGFN